MVQHADVPRERHHGAHDVLDEEDGETLGAVELAEYLHHLVAFGRAQPGHDLVEEQELRARGERARHLEALAIRQRKSGGRGQVELRPEAELLQDAGRVPARGRGMTFVQESTDHHVVEHRQPGESLTIWNVRPMPAAHTSSGRSPWIGLV